MIGKAARSAFAGLEGDWAYFDNAGGSFILQQVVDRVADYLRTSPVQLGGSYPLSRQAAQHQTDAIAALARFVNAGSNDELVLGSSSTALTWQVAHASRSLLQPGDEIIISEIDHEANRSPWLWLAELGVRVRTWQLDRDRFALSLDHLDELLNERTRLVAFSHCSNILGHIEPVEHITRRVHAAGARVFVDGVAFAPHREVDVRKLNVDFYVCSLYKVFGPHLGLLYGRREALLELGNINHEYLPADALPYKLQPGGASYELVWGAAGIVDYFESWQGNAFDDIAAHEQQLIEPLLDFLASQPQVTLYGAASADPRTRLPIIAFRSHRHRSADIVARLQEHRLATRHGHFHARRLLERLGLPVDDGVVRISFAHYNTATEVQRLVSALKLILGDR